MRALSLMMRPLSLVILAAGLFLFGCGSVTDPGESSPDQPRSGPLPPDQFLLNADGGDPGISQVRLVTSVQYDAVLGEAQIFALVRDQNFDDIITLNKYNFSVSLDPVTATRAVDSTSPDATLTRILGVDRKVIALIIDSSGSMAGQKMQDTKIAAKQFINNNLGPDDLAAIIDFDTDARLVQELTSDKLALIAAIDSLVADNATNIGGAVLEGVRNIGVTPGRRAAILLTDGADTVDSITGDENRPVPVVDPTHPVGWDGSWIRNNKSARWRGVEFAIEVGLPVYTIGLGLNFDVLNPSSPSYALNPFNPADLDLAAIADLQIVARMTGADPGKVQPYQAENVAGLTAAYAAIMAEIDAQTPTEPYLFTFSYPPPPQPVQPALPSLLKNSFQVPVRTAVLYFNGRELLRDKFGGSFTVTY